MCFLFCVVVREFLLTMRETGLSLLDRVFSVFFFFALSSSARQKEKLKHNNNNNTKVKSSLNCGVLLLIKTTKEVR